mgnify:CR=1 FL=1
MTTEKGDSSLEQMQKEVKEKGKKASKGAKEAVLSDARRKSREAKESPGLLKARKKIVNDLLAEQEANTENQDEWEIKRLKMELEDIYNKEEKKKS